jgi:hypothetical protein
MSMGSESGRAGGLWVSATQLRAHGRRGLRCERGADCLRCRQDAVLLVGRYIELTVGNHAMKFGYELRENSTTSKVNTFPFFQFRNGSSDHRWFRTRCPQITSGGIESTTRTAFSTRTQTAGAVRNLQTLAVQYSRSTRRIG